nr:LysM domain-containing protein [Streptomyces polyasparticus]
MGIFDVFKGGKDKAEKAGEAVKEQVQEQASAGVSAPESPVRTSAEANSKFTEEAASATQAAADRLMADAKITPPAPQAAPKPAAPAGQAAEPAAAPKEESARTYTVKSGDSLSAIAERELGDMGRWQELYTLNKQTIGNDPDMIQPGMKLKLP